MGKPFYSPYYHLILIFLSNYLDELFQNESPQEDHLKYSPPSQNLDGKF
jgi:hypothetical protein